MAKIEKSQCLEILNTFYEQESHQLSDDEIIDLAHTMGEAKLVNYFNYLYENHLISDKNFSKSIDGHYSFYSRAKITARGIDFLDGESSLGHELNVTTVKLHPQTITDLEAIIKYSNLPPEEKEGLLKELAKHGAKDMVTKSVEYAMTNGGALLMLIQAWLKSQ